MLLLLGGIHGDEPAGTHAAQGGGVRSTAAAFAGNRAAPAGAAAGQIFCFDLHTSSGPGTPLACIGDRCATAARRVTAAHTTSLRRRVQDCSLRATGRTRWCAQSASSVRPMRSESRSGR